MLIFENVNNWAELFVDIQTRNLPKFNVICFLLNISKSYEKCQVYR